MLAEVLQLGGLIDQFVNLLNDVQLLVLLEVPTVEFLLDAVEHLEGPFVLDLRLLLLGFVVTVNDTGRGRNSGRVSPGPGPGARWCAGCDHVGTGTVLGGEEFGWWNFRVENGRATDTASLCPDKGWVVVGWEIGASAWACCVGETPVEERIMDELLGTC